MDLVRKSLLVAFLLPLLLAGEQTGTRPKIGLVLSGGGARGLAHIGVIRWLEEHHIPVDYVAGTSMGGLVGGAYASGMDADELDDLIRGIDWNEVLRGSPRFSDLSFRRKEDQRALPSSVEFGLRGGFNMPSSFIPGQQIGLVLDRIALPYSEVRTFDELPTPFRCVAVDLISGREVVMGDGSLSGALRATMAIPGVFTPVREDSMVLVDGGLLNNLPVDVVKRMGADIVIAVDLGDVPVKDEDLNSIFGLADRAISVMMRVNVERNAKLAQHVISPSIEGIGSLDFSQPAKIVVQGFDEMEKHASELSALAVADDEWQRYRQARRKRRRPREFTPAFIEVDGDAGNDRLWVDQELRPHVGKPLDEDRLSQSLTRITGVGLYDTASYQRASRDAEEGLAVEVQRKRQGPPFLKPLVKINTGQNADMTFEIAARLTLYDVWKSNNEVRLDGSFGRLNLAGAEIYQFLGSTNWFIAPRGFAQYETQLLYDSGDRIADYGVTDIGGGADIGYNFGRSSEVRVGYQYGWQKANVRSGSPLLPTQSGPASTVRGRWSFDRLNSAIVPTDGIRIEAATDYRVFAPGADHDIVQLSAGLSAARPLSDRWFLQWRAAGGGTANGSAGPIQQFTLGGPSRIGALGLGERRGNNFAYASGGVLRLLQQNPGGIVERLYAGAWYEGGDAWNQDLNWFHSGTVGITGETRLGLVFVGASFGESGRARFYLSLGKFF